MIRIGERKQVGLIHHFTFVRHIESIMGDKLHLIANRDYVSFTRNYLLGATSSDFNDTNVRFTFYGTELSDKYKIEPFYDMEIFGDDEEQRLVGRKEAEERINEPEVFIEPKHLAAVQFNFRNLMEVGDIVGRDKILEIRQWLRDNNIPYAVKEGWIHPKKILI